MGPGMEVALGVNAQKVRLMRGSRGYYVYGSGFGTARVYE